MNISNRTSYVGFLMILAALSVPGAALGASPDGRPSAAAALSIEERLSQLSAALQARAEQLPAEAKTGPNPLLAVGFADGAGRGWADGVRGGWVDGHGGSFVNRNPWRNGWGDGGGFANWNNY